MIELYVSGLPSPEAVDELHNKQNPTIHPPPAKGKMNITIKTVRNP